MMRQPKVDIYDLSIECWREVDVEFSSICYLSCSQMYYKDAVHWFTIKKECTWVIL